MRLRCERQQCAASIRGDLVSMPVLVDHRGNPISASSHYGADLISPELQSWNPASSSADGALLPELDTLRNRTQDMIRNHGLTSGAVQIHLDNIIGAGLRLAAKPDWRALGLTAQQAADWSRHVETEFRQWADDIDCYCDASRRKRFAGILAQGYRSYLNSFEILGTLEWLNRPGARYRTAVQLIDPARLSNPAGRQDSTSLRGGIELDGMGAPVAYWISSGIPGDPMQTGMVQWRRVPRETPWGRRMVIHVYDEERAGQTRGKNGIVSVLAKLKMLEKFEQVTLQAAILNAMYAAVIQSSMDWQTVGAAVGAPGSGGSPVVSYMKDRATWHQGGNVRYNGVKIPHLFPGEELKLLSPQHPSAAFSQFEEATLRHIAGGLNLSYEQMSRDYSKSNYSSARAAMLEGWRFFSSRRHFIGGWFATQVYAAWLEEAMDRRIVETPAGAPGFLEAKTAWSRCKWIGPGRGHIDPLKEANATKVEYSMGLTTLEKEAAERGEDWEELLEQRAYERQRMTELGIDPSQMLAPTPAQSPTEVSTA